MNGRTTNEQTPVAAAAKLVHDVLIAVLCRV
jgi:hypothetical protein